LPVGFGAMQLAGPGVFGPPRDRDPYPPGLILVSKVGARRDSRGGILFHDAGFFTIDLGDLITGGQMQQIGAPLAGANLIRLPDPS
jgi:hypothetical protein